MDKSVKSHDEALPPAPCALIGRLLIQPKARLLHSQVGVGARGRKLTPGRVRAKPLRQRQTSDVAIY